MDGTEDLHLNTGKFPTPAFPGTEIGAVRTDGSTETKTFRLPSSDHSLDSDSSYIAGTLLCLPLHLRRRGRAGYFLEEPPSPSPAEIKISSSSANPNPISENINEIPPNVLKTKEQNSIESQSQNEVNVQMTTNPRNDIVKDVNLVSPKLSPIILGIENCRIRRKRVKKQYLEPSVPRKRGRPFKTSIKPCLEEDKPSSLTTLRPKRKRIPKVHYPDSNLHSKSESSERRRPGRSKQDGSKATPLKNSWGKAAVKTSKTTPTKGFSKAPVKRIYKASPSTTVPRQKDVSDSEDMDVDVVTVESENETINLSKRVRNQNFICSVCGKICKSTQALNNHHISHSNVKAYQCDECGNKFKFKNNLHNHIKLYHAGKKLFSCDICEESFARNAELRMHRLLHSEKEPIKCSVLNCNNLYASLQALQKHKLKDHNDGIKPVPIFVRKLKPGVVVVSSSKVNKGSSHRLIGGQLPSKSSEGLKVKPKSAKPPSKRLRQVIQDLTLSSDSEDSEEGQSVSAVPENKKSTPEQQPSHRKNRGRLPSKSSKGKGVKVNSKSRIINVPSKRLREVIQDLTLSSDSEEGQSVSTVPEKKKSTPQQQQTPHGKAKDHLSSKSPKGVKVSSKSRIIKVPLKRELMEDFDLSSDSESQSGSTVPENEKSIPQQQQTPGKTRGRLSSKSPNGEKVNLKRRKRVTKGPSKPSKDWLWLTDSDSEVSND